MKKSFADWLKEVDKHVKAKVGLSYQDLADQPFRDWYEDRVSPKSAASRLLKAEMGE